MYKYKVVNPKQDYSDRTESLKIDFHFHFQDRIDGIEGITIKGVRVKSDSFTTSRLDKKNCKGMSVQLDKSQYGEYGKSYLRLSEVEIAYKSKKKKEDFPKKEMARIEKYIINWFGEYGKVHKAETQAQ